MTTTYQITKPLSQLPPLRAKGIIANTNGEIIDFVKKYNALAVHIELHKRSGGNVEWRINDENDLMTLTSTEIRVLDNVIIERLEIISSGNDLAIFCTLAPLPLLRRWDALEVG